MTVHFSSFKRMPEEARGEVYSIAVYQPKWLEEYPKAGWADIRDHTGRWYRPREFVRYLDPLRAYRDALWGLYLSREEEIKAFFEQHAFKDLTFLCWCPYDKAAQRQLEKYGTFVCHSEVVRLFIASMWGIQTSIDEDRYEMKELSEVGDLLSG